MDRPPFSRDGCESRAAFHPPSHPPFPQRVLYTVPEYETESSADLHSVQYSSTLSGFRNGPGILSVNGKNYPFSEPHLQAHESSIWFPREMEKLESETHARRAYHWTLLLRLAFHVINLAASIAIVALVAQALLTHQRLHQVRQFSGADNAWPKHMSLTASIILLSAASTNVVKSATFLVVEVCRRARPHSNIFHIVLTACSALMAAIWVTAIVLAEINRQSNDNFATWACARSDAATNDIIPYRAICNDEVIASRLAVAVLVIEMVLGTCSVVLIILDKFHPPK